MAVDMFLKLDGVKDEAKDGLGSLIATGIFVAFALMAAQAVQFRHSYGTLILASDRPDAPCAASTRESKLPAASAGSSGSRTKFFTTPTIFRLVSKDLPRFLDRKQSFLRPERSFVRNIRENLG